MIRRRGEINGFWGVDTNLATPLAQGVIVMAEETGSSQPSRPQYVGQATDQLAIWVNADRAATFTVQIAPSGPLSVDGVDPDVNTPPTIWGNLYYPNQASPVTIALAASGTQSLILPHFEPGWVRLTSGVDCFCIAGWEASAP